MSVGSGRRRYNLFERTKVESDYVPLYSRYGLGTTIWSPLAFGLLSGKYAKGVIPEGSRFSLEVSMRRAKVLGLGLGLGRIG